MTLPKSGGFKRRKARREKGIPTNDLQKSVAKLPEYFELLFPGNKIQNLDEKQKEEILLKLGSQKGWIELQRLGKKKKNEEELKIIADRIRLNRNDYEFQQSVGSSLNELGFSLAQIHKLCPSYQDNISTESDSTSTTDENFELNNVLNDEYVKTIGKDIPKELSESQDAIGQKNNSYQLRWMFCCQQWSKQNDVLMDCVDCTRAFHDGCDGNFEDSVDWRCNHWKYSTSGPSNTSEYVHDKGEGDLLPKTDNFYVTYEDYFKMTNNTDGKINPVDLVVFYIV